LTSERKSTRAVGREVKQKLRVVERLLDAHQLHVQLVFLDLAQADLVRLLLERLVFLRVARVALVRDAQDGFARRGDQIVADLANAGDHPPVFHAPRGLHDHVLAGDGPQLARIEVV
jgi:hypothetical protein